MIADAPYVRLLLAAAQTLEATNLNDAGIAAGVLVTVRHARSRKVMKGERPGISIVFVGDDPTGAEDLNNDETQREMVFDLQCDVEMETEVSGEDPTGLGLLSRLAAVATRALRDDASPLRALCDFVTPGSVDPDDENRGDEGRLVRRLSVLYRVRSDDENVLLAAGENG